LLTTLRPPRELYPSSSGAATFVQRDFSGEQTSEIGLDAGMLKDICVTVRPDFEAATRGGGR